MSCCFLQQCHLYSVFSIISDIYPGSSTHSKVFSREVLHPIELEFGNVDFWGEGKTGEPGEKPLGAEERTNNQLNPLMATSPKLNPGHVGGRRVQSPVRHSCSPILYQYAEMHRFQQRHVTKKKKQVKWTKLWKSWCEQAHLWRFIFLLFSSFCSVVPLNKSPSISRIPFFWGVWGYQTFFNSKWSATDPRILCTSESCAIQSQYTKHEGKDYQHGFLIREAKNSRFSKSLGPFFQSNQSLCYIYYFDERFRYGPISEVAMLEGDVRFRSPPSSSWFARKRLLAG